MYLKTIPTESLLLGALQGAQKSSWNLLQYLTERFATDLPTGILANFPCTTAVGPQQGFGKSLSGKSFGQVP